MAKFCSLKQIQKFLWSVSKTNSNKIQTADYVETETEVDKTNNSEGNFIFGCTEFISFLETFGCLYIPAKYALISSTYSVC